MDHKITVVYTTDDDGIWLHCTCGWEQCLGYDPSVDCLVQAQQSHQNQITIVPSTETQV
jgi:hypothetical protein